MSISGGQARVKNINYLDPRGLHFGASKDGAGSFKGVVLSGDLETEDPSSRVAVDFVVERPDGDIRY